MPTPLLDVQAHWAYTEIIGGTHLEWYDTLCGAQSLRDKRAAGVPLEQLSYDEKYALAFQALLRLSCSSVPQRGAGDTSLPITDVGGIPKVLLRLLFARISKPSPWP